MRKLRDNILGWVSGECCPHDAAIVRGWYEYSVFVETILENPSRHNMLRAALSR